MRFFIYSFKMTAIKRNRGKAKKISKRDPLVGVRRNRGEKQERINRERMYNYNLRLILIIVSMKILCSA